MSEPADNGCDCRLCTYNREYDAMIELVPEPARAFFADLYERYGAADFDAEWARACMDKAEWEQFDRHSRRAPTQPPDSQQGHQ